MKQLKPLFTKRTHLIILLLTAIICKTYAQRTPENPANTENGLEYAYYEGTWSVLPDFNALTPKKSGDADNFSLVSRDRNDNFAFRFTGFISVATAGTYTFYTSSDDGSKLYIGSTEVVNNDGLHGKRERSGTISLGAGKHALTVTFFEKTGGEVLEVSYSGPGISKQLIPSSVLFRETGGNGGGTVCSGCPSDNAYKTKYASTPSNHWTNQLKWNYVVNINDYSGSTMVQRFNNAQTAVSNAGGGVVYFPAGTYNFEDNIDIKDGVILRGPAPTVNDAKNSGFAPPARLVFPKYVPSFSGSGTPNSTAFKQITSNGNASNIGLVYLDINRASIKLSVNLGAVSGFTTPQPIGTKTNVLVFGVRSNNAATPDPNVPTATQNAWQRWSYRFGRNIFVYVTANSSVNNNRVNDFTNNTTHSISDDSYDQPGYVVTGTFTGSSSQPSGATSSGTTTITNGSWARFDYSDHYGIEVNRGKENVVFGTPTTEPSLFAPGIEVSDNWVLTTKRIKITASGQGLVIKNNVVTDRTGKRNFLKPGGDRLENNNSATLENRGIDWSGHDVTVDNNSVTVYQHAMMWSGYNSVDGEGILIQECCGGTSVDGATITNNDLNGSGAAYIGLYKMRDINDVLISNNDFAGATGGGIAQIYVNANTNGANYSLNNVSVTGNTNVKGISVTGTKGGSNNSITNNSGSGSISRTCNVSVSGNTGFTLNACTPVTAAAALRLLPEESDVVALEKDCINAFPNPSTGSFNISATKNLNKAITLQIFNANGKLVYKKTSKTDINETVDLKRFGKGLYIAKILKDGKVITKSLMIE